MRLINTTTLDIKFFSGDVPPYAILSHTWGEEEVTFQDMERGLVSASARKGFAKIRGCCDQAVRDGYAWAWVDTCCIDKTSSSELSEAINSMYQWYKASAVCYVYMEDVEATSAATPVPGSSLHLHGDAHARRSNAYGFSRSRWFRRGWTLQELISPPYLEFYDMHWSELGTKSSLLQELRRITGIRTGILMGDPMTSCCMAERMSWAANRETTNVEDRAYSLLGIFDVNMPLLYGEGERAFIRLQEEILRRHEDLSLLVWSMPNLPPGRRSVLAPEPRAFSVVLATRNPPVVRDRRSAHQGITWKDVEVLPWTDFEAHATTSRGLLVTLLIDDPRSYGVPHGDRDVLAWTHLVANLDTRHDSSIMLCTLLRVSFPGGGFEGTIKDFPDYMTAESPVSSRKLGLMCVPRRCLEKFTPKKFYLPTAVEAPNAGTEWLVKLPWLVQGLPRSLQADLVTGFHDGLNVLTFHLGAAARQTMLDHHQPRHLRMAELKPGIFSIFMPAPGGTGEVPARQILLFCRHHHRRGTTGGGGGGSVPEMFVVHFLAIARPVSGLLLSGCSVLRWTKEIEEEGLLARAVRLRAEDEDVSGVPPLGDRSHLRLDSGAVVAAGVKQYVRSVRENKSLVEVSLIVTVTD
ncbi:uncharacterized protein DNG_05944 [Cephalotrichum gorgonifer]|uniref:HET domain-containing protein n=1 Tax=Cephalotrichum gorgonifer TaxID=2041049 RepID=A0AAE8MZ62_9PEZI|nr:uncharacterized protein DNG_05944 [Cephalotrichum gorgonifer]